MELTINHTPAIHHRRNIRLKEYYYARAGLYFITICAKNRNVCLGKLGMVKGF
jgi:putative transposase